jgi:protease-4
MFALSMLLFFLVGRGPAVPSGATLVLRVGGDPAEIAPNDVVSYLRRQSTPTVSSIVRTLHMAKVDSRIERVLLEPTGFTSAYWGKVQEIRDAVADFRTSGKPVYAFLQYGADRDYYLATAADKIFLMPSGSLDVNGVATYEVFLRGTLDKVGVYPDLHHIGDYKTAPNTLTETGYTPAHREMDESLSRSLYDEIVRVVAESRHKAPDQVRQVMDRGPLLPEAALDAGLIDGVAYEDEVSRDLRVATGTPENASQITADQYGAVDQTSLGLNRGPRVAVLYLTGEIIDGKSGFDPLNGAVMGSDTVAEYLRSIRGDSRVRAVVLRIDSPGGSATASDAIWHELMRTRQDDPNRPIVASMGDLAASGGYYVAMAAQAIVAQPSTLTGSIGIFGGKYVTGGLYEKLGAHIDSASFGRFAEMDSPARPYTPDELKALDGQLRAFYDQFVRKAADARGRTVEQIDAVGQGRVWTGRQAVDEGLVDEVGGMDRAIALAKERAHIPADSGVELVVYPPRKTFVELLADSLNGTTQGAAIRSALTTEEASVLRMVRGPFALFRRGEPLALMPQLMVQ